MPDIKIRQFRPDDIKAIRPIESQTEKFAALEKRSAETNAEGGPAYTATLNGAVLGCAGIRLYWQGVGEGWMYLGLNAIQYKKEIYRLLKGKMNDLMKQNNIWRLQAYVRCNLGAGVLFLEHLGFEREGIMRRYTPEKDDCYLYALIKE